MRRCRNCAVLGHGAQNCPRWGPVHPGPGKTASDYEYVTQQLCRKLLQDEHDIFGDPDSDGDWGGKAPGRSRTPIGRLRLSFECATCGAQPGGPCIGRAGHEVESVHRDRAQKAARAVDEEE